MKTQRVFYGLMLLVAGIFSGCNNDIDLQNIDTRMEIDMGLALPIGSMSATVGDFLGDGQVKGIYVGENNVLFYRDTFDVSRRYHDVDMTAKVSNTARLFDVYKELNRQGYVDADGTVNRTGKQIKLEFPFAMKLNKINEDVNDERIDSVRIKTTKFTSAVGQVDLPLAAGWVDKIELELGEEFHRKYGNTITICQKGDFAYDERIPIEVDEFVLDLMRTHNPGHWSAYKNNVKDSCHFKINFYYTIPSGTTVKVPKTAKYKYQLQMHFTKFEAVWGFFKPSADMRDADTVNIEEEWENWNLFKKAKLPFYDPRVNLNITSKIAGAMCTHGEYGYVESLTTGEKIFLTFDNAETQIYRNDKFNNPGQYMTLDSKIGDSITNTILFDKDPLRGHIDKAFTIRPDLLGYKFYLDYDSITTPQIRILPNTLIRMEADVYAQFRFNQGLEASYTDTLKEININEISLDSLAESSELLDTVKTADLKLVLAFVNKLPMRVRAVPEFLDADGDPIMDPAKPSQKLKISENDTLLLNAPQIVFEQGRSYIGDADTTIFTITMDKAHYETFARIKQMKFYAELDAEQMDYAYKRDPEYKVQITTEDNLKVYIGVSTKVDAVLNPGSKNDKK